MILLFYDLCTENKDYRCEYRNFVKYLKSEGYMPLQESVFFKYIRNVSMAKFGLDRIGDIPITQGNVFCLVLSYGTFKKWWSCVAASRILILSNLHTFICKLVR